MLKWSRLLYGRHFLLLLLLLALTGTAGCSKINPLSFLGGGGPNVAANVQAGKTNSQTIGTTKNTSQKLVRPQARTINQTADTNDVRANNVEKVVVYKSNPWMWVALIVALFLDSPTTIAKRLGAKIFRRT